jgi:hypothetical protein
MTETSRDRLDGNQLPLPDSFHRLHLDARGRLRLPQAELLRRAELCEDLAQQLQDSARHIHFDLGVAEEDVLSRIHAGLTSPQADLQPGEAEWVTARVAELLDWLDQLQQDLRPPVARAT